LLYSSPDEASDGILGLGFEAMVDDTSSKAARA
jgi:hypothetical protein